MSKAQHDVSPQNLATRFHYDLWGEAVNTASDLQSAAAPGMILVSQDAYERVRDLYVFTPHAYITTSNGTDLAVWTLEAATGRPETSPDTVEADDPSLEEVQDESD